MYWLFNTYLNFPFKVNGNIFHTEYLYNKFSLTCKALFRFCSIIDQELYFIEKPFPIWDIWIWFINNSLFLWIKNIKLQNEIFLFGKTTPKNWTNISNKGGYCPLKTRCYCSMCTLYFLKTSNCSYKFYIHPIHSSECWKI